MRWLLLALAACHSSSPPTATYTSEPTHAPSGNASRPPLATTCTADADCAVTSDDVDGPTACCPGCQWHAATTASLAVFRQSCVAAPAPQCPPIGCAMADLHAACVDGACVAR